VRRWPNVIELDHVITVGLDLHYNFLLRANGRQNRSGYHLGAESPFILSEPAGAGVAGLELLSVPLPEPWAPGAILFEGAGMASPVVPFVAESTFIAGSAVLLASPAFAASCGVFWASALIGRIQASINTPYGLLPV
jgi:hypothetical protein